MMRVVRSLVATFVAVVAFAALGAQPASAQTYSFDYSGSSGGNTINWTADITGLTCSPTCTLTSSSQLTNGTITIVTPGLSPDSFVMSFNPADSAFGPIDNLINVNSGVDGEGLDFEATIGGNVVTFNVSDSTGTNPANGSGGVETGVFVVNNGSIYSPNTQDGDVSSFDAQGTLTISEQAGAPAPAVGGGVWSWLALGAAGLVGVTVRRKSISNWARSAWAPGAA
jgi:hypothetical protein